MSWWYSKPVEDEKYVMIEDKMEAFQNTISKLQSEIENLKCEKDSLIVIISNLRKDFEKQKLITDESLKTLKTDILKTKNPTPTASGIAKTEPITIEPEPVWYDTIDYMKPKHISKEVFISPLELLKSDEKDCLDDFLNEVLEMPKITADKGTITIGGGLKVDDCHTFEKSDIKTDSKRNCDTKEDKPLIPPRPTRQSERLKNKNLKRTKRILTKKEVWKA